MKLIDNYKDAWKLWSIRMGLLGTTLMGFLLAYPEAALDAWNMLPQDMKDTLPDQFVPFVGMVIFMLSMFARVIKQTELGQQPPQLPQEQSNE